MDQPKHSLTSSLTAEHLEPLEMCTTCNVVVKVERVFVTERGATEDALMQSHKNILVKKERDSESMDEAEYSDLYEEHEVKQELVLGPEMLQPQDIAFDPAEQPETPAAVITSQCQIQNKEKAKEGEIAIGHPVEEVQNTVINTVRSQKNFDPNNFEYCAECNLKTMQKKHTRKEPYKCTACSYRCMRKINLLKHKRTHSGEKPYKCKICAYKASNTSCLNEHLMRVHSARVMQVFKCSHCSYTCKYKSHLLRHERTHTGEKPYKCDFCDYKTARTSCLKLHLISVHADIKPFKCSHCSYMCSQKSHLLKHEMTHTGEKPYKCDTCDYKTAFAFSLSRHIMGVHAGVKPFKCSHCSYRCVERTNLIKHERTHTGEKPYKCEICAYEATQSVSLKRHIKSIHSVEKRKLCR